ncbi:DUF4865 family protein [Streptomyces sp. XD-27]|uniref:DUF4865 family protein n=1 Tax=Streptomyces sp. XD-27 TaxID=3062779 RepID=UPI0026F46FFF|nr:DUF4865 family protein [Streptomyces sp. XD-27]WKX73631.1 DUF4865 family protein [Streptomyces sp. XD-27]
MHAMQYRITLPADYDMEIIRRRVATRGHLLDDFPGLGLKAYGIRERGVDGSPVNAYAPFYLWASPEAMNRFLWGAGFRGLVEDFGRPTVEHWQGLAFERGPAADRAPRTATRRAEPVPPGADPATAVERALAETGERARTEGVHSTALAIDPRHWELLHFTLWRDDAPEAAGDRFQVLHLSAPHLDALPQGRHW